jgi:hypothetical protein
MSPLARELYCLEIIVKIEARELEVKNLESIASGTMSLKCLRRREEGGECSGSTVEED